MNEEVGSTLVHVKFTDKSMAALQSSVEVTELSRVDVINRAVQVHEAIIRAVNQGGGVTLEFIPYPNGPIVRMPVILDREIQSIMLVPRDRPWWKVWK